jgi:preprotein translocase subunit SecE
MRGFTAESYGELRKVEWPGRRQLVSSSVVVLIAIAVVGAYLAAADFVFSRLVRDVLLRF